MSIFKTAYLKTLCLAVIGLMVVSIFVALPKILVDQAAFAQEPRKVKQRPAQRSSPQMRPDIYKLFEAAQKAAEEDNITEAMALIDKLLSRKGLSSYEEALGHNFKGYTFYEAENYTAAIREYEYILSLPKIPYQFSDQIAYTVAQIQMVVGNYEEALVLLNDWFQYQENPRATAYIFGGQLYYQLGQELESAKNMRAAVSKYDEGIPFIETAIEMALASETLEVRENWYQLLSAMYYAKADYSKVKDILEIVIVKWPRPQYWIQLSAMYSQLEENDKQLAVMDVAYRLGFLDKAATKKPEKPDDGEEESKTEKEEKARGNLNIINMAQLYNLNGAPYLAAKAMENGFADGELEKGNQKNQKLLGEAWLTSREYERSTVPLNLAARDADDGALYIQLGHVYSTLEDWAKTAQAIQRAINKGDLKRRDQAYLYMGMAYFNMEEFKKAEAAFREARKDERSRRTVNGWLKYITNEKARLVRLANAGLR